jgi:Protein of unknown function DUF115
MLANAKASVGLPEGGDGVPLPADFSHEHDVLVLAGTGAASCFPELARRGVGRVVVFAPTGEDLPPTYRVAKSAPDVVAHILDFEPAVRRISLRRLPSGVSDEEFDTLKKTVEGGGMNRATFASYGATWVKHAFANLPYLARWPSIECLKGAFAGKPCVLVSPGPSLSKNIGVLKELADHVLIIAGNRALAPLRHAGIVPHFVIVADALDLKYQLDGGLLDGVLGLVLEVAAHPAVCALSASHCFYFSAIHEIHTSTLAGLGQKAFLSGGGSVATVALTLALHLGADPIAMVGQDLALDGEQYYIPSAPDGDTRIRLADGVGVFENLSPELRQAMHKGGGAKLDQEAVQHFLKVPGFHGGEVLTSVQFDTYRRWLGRTAREQAGKVRLVNCTEGGARIDDMQQARLADLAAELQLSPIDAATVIEACQARSTEKERLQAVERHIKHLQEASHATLEEVQRCERISHQVERAPEQLQRLDKAELKLNEAVRKLPFVTALTSVDVENARRAGANATNLAESLRATRALYSAIKQAVLLVRPALSEALQRLKGAT